MESGNNFPLVYLENYDLQNMQIYYFEIENTPKVSEFELEYRLLDHLVAQMAITGFKICSLWDLLYKNRFMLRDH